MTDNKPRKRAKALPVLEAPFDPGALWSYGPGVRYDPALPDSLRAAIPPQWAAVLDMPAFTSALGAVFGRYRYYDAIATDEQAAKIALEHTRLAARVLEEARSRVHHLPPLAKSLLDLRAQTDSEHSHTMLDRALALDAVLVDLQWATAEIAAHFAPRRGRTSDPLRDALFTDVRDLILTHASVDCTKEKATELVQTLMIAARVSVPTGIEDIQKRIRAVERQREQDTAALLAMIEASASAPGAGRKP
jgi:hypothetical protein